MTRLDGQDRSGGRKVVLVHDLAGGAEIGANTYALEDAGDAQKLCDGRHGEAVDAFLRRRGAESGGQEVDVGFFVAGDFGQTGVGAGWEACCGEIDRAEFSEAFAVECCFKVFESESILEDIDWEK